MRCRHPESARSECPAYRGDNMGGDAGEVGGHPAVHLFPVLTAAVGATERKSTVN